MYICIVKRFQTSTCFGVLNFALNLTYYFGANTIGDSFDRTKKWDFSWYVRITILEKDFASIAEAERDGNNNNPCGRPTILGT